MTSSSTNYRIVVLGSGGVGKSALTLRLISDEFAEEYDPTIEDSYRKQVVIDGKPALLDVLDTAGQEEYASLQDQWIREGDGYLIVYSITSRDSLEESKVMHDKISRIRDSEDFPLVLAGNKCDLVNERQVSAETGKETIASWNSKRKEGACKVSFFETSAKGKINTDEAFHQVVRNIRASKAQTDTGGSKKKKGFCTLL